VLEHKLHGCGFVHTVNGNRRMLNVLDSQYGVGVPHVLRQNGLPNEMCELLRVWRRAPTAMPVGERPIEQNATVALEHEYLAKPFVVAIGVSALIAPCRGAHVPPLAA